MLIGGCLRGGAKERRGLESRTLIGECFGGGAEGRGLIESPAHLPDPRCLHSALRLTSPYHRWLTTGGDLYKLQRLHLY